MMGHVFLVGIVTFVSEYLDSGLGMGYGTVLSPILMLFGYSLPAIIPAVLVSQLVTDVAACFSHHHCANVQLRFGSPDLKAALWLGSVGSAGVIVSVVAVFSVPSWILRLYVGFLVTMMGILICATVNRVPRYSWRGIVGVSFLAAFNKGISGGGYGPLVMGGQLLSGVSPKSAVGITAFAEALTCLVGFIAFWVLGRSVDWKLTGLLIIAATPAVPIAALTVKKIPARTLKTYVGVLITILGIVTLVRLGRS